MTGIGRTWGGAELIAVREADDGDVDACAALASRERAEEAERA
jgi:hypothetical protein